MIKIFFLTLIVSLLANILFFAIDILPAIKEIIMRKRLQLINTRRKGKNLDVEKLVVKQALCMAKTKKVIMPIAEHSHFLNNIRKMFNGRKQQKCFRYHYPKGYLFAGLTEYATIKKDNKLLNKIVKEFEPYINEDGMPKFLFDKVDQAPFGIAAINLFASLGIAKYKIMADFIFEKVNELADKNNDIIYYRQESSINFVDAIGMVCPFLVRYGVKFNNDLALHLAHKQLEYYINHGLDRQSYLPSHALTKDSHIRVGSYNWGRGIGWYLLGLSEYLRLTKDLSFNTEYSKLIDTLLCLRTKKSVWSQFPGSSNEFDASATIMFMYGINCLLNTFNKEDILNTLSRYIINGIIRCTSGDTYSANRYSNTFGDSELTQGFLLMLLSSAEK